MNPETDCRWTIVTSSPAETQALGRLVGALAELGTVVLLTGELGAGKTCFAQGAAAGLGVTDQVVSPTFILAAEYPGRLPLFHLDLYRIERPEEAEGLDLDRFLGGRGITLVEWPERAPDLWPEDHLSILLTHVSEEQRCIVAEAAGPRSERVLQRVRLEWMKRP